MNCGIWLKREYLERTVIEGGKLVRKDVCGVCDATIGHVIPGWKYCPMCGSRLFATVDDLRHWHLTHTESVL